MDFFRTSLLTASGGLDQLLLLLVVLLHLLCSQPRLSTYYLLVSTTPNTASPETQTHTVIQVCNRAFIGIKGMLLDRVLLW